MTSRRGVQALVAVLVVLLAACSGGSSTDDTEAATSAETEEATSAATEEATTEAAATEEATTEAAATEEATTEAAATEGGEEVTLTDPIHICEIAMLTGPVGFFGTELDAGAQIGVARANEEGGIHGAELVYDTFDNASDTDQAVTLGEACVNDPQYPAMVAHITTANQLALMPDVDAGGLPALSTSVARPIPEIGDYIFRTAASDPVLIPDMVNTLVPELGTQTVAFLRVLDDPASEATYNAYLTAFEGLGVENLGEQTYLSTDTDWSSQLLQIRELNPDAIVLAIYAQEGGALLLQARNEVGIPVETELFGGAQLNSQAALDQAGAAADNVFVPDFWNLADDSPENPEFIAAFEAANGRPPTRFAATGYNTARFLTEALLAAEDPYDRDSVQAAMAGISDFQYVGCPMLVDDIGAADCEPGTTLPIQAVGGQFVIYEG